MNIYYVYQYLRSKDSEVAPAGTPYYIGKGKKRRAWQKGPSEIQPPNDPANIVIIADQLTESQAFDLEKQLITEFGRIDLNTGILRNRSDGGEGPAGVVRSAEWCERQSQDRKGKKLNLSEESRTKLSKARSEANNNPEHRKKVAERWQDPKFRQKMSEAKRNISDETCARMSEATKKKWQDPEYKARVRKSIQKGHQKSQTTE